MNTLLGAVGDLVEDVVVHLLEEEYDGDLAQALSRVYPKLEGHFSIVAIHHDQPDLLARAVDDADVDVAAAGLALLVEGIEQLPKRVRVMPADVKAIKEFIAAECA